MQMRRDARVLSRRAAESYCSQSELKSEVPHALAYVRAARRDDSERTGGPSVILNIKRLTLITNVNSSRIGECRN